MKIVIVALLALWLLSASIFFLLTISNAGQPSWSIPDIDRDIGIVSLIVSVLSFIGFATCLLAYLL